MKSSILIAGFLVFMIASWAVSAEEVPLLPAETGFPQPMIPHSFYGSITAAGSPVPAGVPVEVDAPGIKKGIPENPVYSNEGGYGSPDPFRLRLAAQGTMEPGTELVFYVGGVRAEVRPSGTENEWQSSFAYSPGGVTSLDLRVSVPVTPDPAFHMTPEETSSQPVKTPLHGQSGPSQEVMLGLVAILVILAITAFFLGKRAEKKEKKSGGEEGTIQEGGSPPGDEKPE